MHKAMQPRLMDTAKPQVRDNMEDEEVYTLA
jgi:hypothetical protein